MGPGGPWRDPVRRSEIAVLDGVTRADVLADIHLFGATMQWLVRLVVEHERKLIITIDDDWNDRESGLPGGKPIRGIRNLIADATGQLILTYGSVYPVGGLGMSGKGKPAGPGRESPASAYEVARSIGAEEDVIGAVLLHGLSYNDISDILEHDGSDFKTRSWSDLGGDVFLRQAPGWPGHRPGHDDRA